MPRYAKYRKRRGTRRRRYGAKKSFRRRSYGRRRKGRSLFPNSRINSTRFAGVPGSYKCKLTYPDTSTFSTAVLADGTQGTRFSGCSNFDPFKGGGGSQPYYYDTIAESYLRYRVLGVRLSIVIDTPSIAGWLAILVSTTTTSGLGLSSFDDVRGQKGVKTQRVEPTQAKTLSIHTYQSTRRVFGNQYGSKERDLTSVIASDPTIDYYLHVFWLRDDAAATAQTFRWRWTSYTIFYDTDPENVN